MGTLTINNLACGSAITTTTTVPCISCCSSSGYGALYNWYAATDVRNIANTGWHVPSRSEYNTMISYIGTDGALQLKEEGFNHWQYSSSNEGTNTLKFNSRASARRGSTTGGFNEDGPCGMNFLWTTTVYSPNRAYAKYLHYDYNEVLEESDGKDAGLSIRLLKDSTILSHGEDGTYIGNDGTIYSTICIGTQEWLAFHLNETKYRNGDWIAGFDGGVYTPIPNLAWAALTTGAMCYNNDNESNA